MIGNENLRGIPLLLLANKQDLPGLAWLKKLITNNSVWQSCMFFVKENASLLKYNESFNRLTGIDVNLQVKGAMKI